MITLVYNRNCVYQTAYHVVWCPKYRKSILKGEVAVALKQFLEEICTENAWSILTMEFQPAHIPLFVSIPPATAVSDAVKKLKGTSARKLFLRYPELKKQLWDGHLCSPSYYVGTEGKVSAENQKHYNEKTENIQGRQ